MTTKLNKVIMPENLQSIYELVDSQETIHYALSKLKQIDAPLEVLEPLKMAFNELADNEQNLDRIWQGQKQKVAPLNILEFGSPEVVELPEMAAIEKPLDDLNIYLLFDEQDKVHVQYFLNEQLLDDFCRKKDLKSEDLFNLLNPSVVEYLRDLNLEINEGQITLNNQVVSSEKLIKLINNPPETYKVAAKNLTERLQKKRILSEGKSIQLQGVNTKMQYILEANPDQKQTAKK